MALLASDHLVRRAISIVIPACVKVAVVVLTTVIREDAALVPLPRGTRSVSPLLRIDLRLLSGSLSISFLLVSVELSIC